MRPIILHFHVIHVKVSSCSWCTRTLLMNVAIDSEHCDCERILCKDWVWLKMCGKRSRMWPKQEHGIKVWYFDSWTWCKKSCDIWRWSLVPPRLVSHCSACEWSHMEAIVHMANSWMGSMCVVSLFGEEYGFVVKCNICSIMCEAWASTFSPCHDTLTLQKGLITMESIYVLWSKCVASHLPNHFSISCIQPEHK